MTYSYSFEQHGRYYGDFESIEEALKEAREEAADYLRDKPEMCFIGEQIEFQPQIDVDCVIEQLQDSADDFGGEYADDYLKYVSDEERKELGKLLQKVYDEWEEKTQNKATFFQIEDAKAYSLVVTDD